eukprot:scaffold62609_cov69-Phaeocystis_antarctica.AAC.1
MSVLGPARAGPSERIFCSSLWGGPPICGNWGGVGNAVPAPATLTGEVWFSLLQRRFLDGFQRRCRFAATLAGAW